MALGAENDGVDQHLGLRAAVLLIRLGSRSTSTRLIALEQRLSEALGRDLADQLEPRAERPDELCSQVRDAEAHVFELREQLADAREELDAVREINRELLADRNRSVP